MSAYRNNLIETIEPKHKAASTDLVANTWVQFNGTGQVEPLEPATPVAGLLLESVSAADGADFYASTDFVSVDQISETVDRFLMDVTEGTATIAMEGQTFDVDAADPGGLDVSGAGTQFEITRFISETLVEVKVNLTKADAVV